MCKGITNQWWNLGGAVFAIALCVTACGGPPQPVAEPEPAFDPEAEGASALSSAVAAQGAGQFSEADSQYQRALELRPAHFETVMQYSQFLLEQKRPVDAVDLLGPLVTQHRDTAGDGAGNDAGGAADDDSIDIMAARHLLADAQVQAKDFEAADETLSAVIDVDGESATAYGKRGAVRIEREQFSEAVADLRRAMELDPENSAYRIDLARALAGADQVSESIAELRGVMAHEPENPQAMVVLGTVLRSQGDRKAALDYHSKAVELAPDDAAAHFELGVSQNYMRRNQEAEASIKRATELGPDNALYWYAYGEVLRAQQRFEEAITPYRQALSLDPGHEKAPNKLGMVLLYAEKYAEAEEVLLARVERASEDPDPYFTLGEVYDKQDKFREAVDAYQKFVELVPRNHPNANKARQRVRVLKRKIR